MLVKIGSNSAINMRGVIDVFLREEKKVITEGGGWFKKGTEKTEYSYFVEINYKNVDDLNAKFTYGCGDNLEFAQKVKDEVLNQVKEIENVGATQALEEAIRNG